MYASVTNAEGDQVCPVCSSDFIELTEGVPPVSNTSQPAFPFGITVQQNAHHSFVAPDGTNLEFHMATAAIPSHVIGALRSHGSPFNMAGPAGNAMIIHLSNGPMSPFDFLGDLDLGDFASGESFDHILTRLLEAYQPPIVPTSESVRNNLPRRPVRPATTTEDSATAYASCHVGEACTVCHEEWKPEEEVVELPCQHCYHETCIMPWLQEHNTCPVCRHKLQVETSQAASRQQTGSADSVDRSGPAGQMNSPSGFSSRSDRGAQVVADSSDPSGRPPRSRVAGSMRTTFSRGTGPIASTTIPGLRDHLSRTQSQLDNLQVLLSQQQAEQRTLQQELQDLQSHRAGLQERSLNVALSPPAASMQSEPFGPGPASGGHSLIDDVHPPAARVGRTSFSQDAAALANAASAPQSSTSMFVFDVGSGSTQTPRDALPVSSWEPADAVVLTSAPGATLAPVRRHSYPLLVVSFISAPLRWVFRRVLRFVWRPQRD